MRPFAWTVVALLALVFGINGAARWDKERQEARVRQLTRAFRPGHAMVFSGYVDERRLQKARVATIPPPRIVAFGSSRIRSVSSDMLRAGPGAFYNAGMSAASVEDYIAVWWLLTRAGKIPKVAVFSLDAWLFNAAHEQVRWLALDDAVARFLEATGDDRSVLSLPLDKLRYGWYRGKEFISFTVLMTSTADLERLLLRGRRLGDRVAEAVERDLVPEAEVAGRNAIRADGSLVRPEGRPTVADLHAAAWHYVTSGDAHLGGFRWDADRARRLERLWHAMRARGVDIVAYMPPYQPAAWQLLRSDPAQAAAIATTATFLRELAGRLGIRFIDASDPASIPCAEAEFYDAEHADPACLARLVTRLGIERE